MKTVITFCIVAMVAAFSTPQAVWAQPSPAVCVAVQGLSQSQKLTLIAAQGLSNRTGAHVFLDFGKDNRWMDMDYQEAPKDAKLQSWNPQTSDAFKAQYPTISLAWLKVFEEGSYFKFNHQPWESFLKQTASLSKGWIVYDNFEDEVALVGTLAGQRDALPVLRKDLPAMQAMLPALPIVFDTKTIPSIPDVGRKVLVHRWMLENIIPHVSKTGLVSRVKNYGATEHDTFVDIDQAVQEKWLVYDLTHYTDATADHPDPKKSKPLETEALLSILGAYPPLTPVFGWGATDENTFTRTITTQGLVVICSGVPNNSFFNRWKASELPLKQKHRHVSDDLKVENKIYLAFMVNEGDSIKNAIGLQGHGGWLQPERGSVPINWGAEPAIFERYSGLMEYYYKGATPNDYFFSAAAGWGYVHPGRMTPPMAQNYVAQINKGFTIADTSYVDIWWIKRSGPVWDAFAHGMKAKGLTQWDNSQQKVDYKIADFPVIHSNHYYTFSDPTVFAKTLIEDYKDVKGPWFVTIYGANRHLTPYKVKALMDLLPADRFKPVLLDEFFTAARLSQKEVEGRVWKPGPNAPKGVAP